MPVAVDALPEGAPSQLLNSEDATVPLPQESPKKTRGPRKNKRQDAEAEQPIAGSSNVTDEWAWSGLGVVECRRSEWILLRASAAVPVCLPSRKTC